MEVFTQLFGDLVAFVYHCFDRIVIYGYLSGLSRPEQVVHFFRQVVGVPVVGKDSNRNMAIGRSEDRDTPWDPMVLRQHFSVWDPIRVTHLGPRSSDRTTHRPDI